MSGKKTRKIAVAGAGAVGSLIGGLLSEAGEDVTLIARPDHVRAIQKKGLHIGGIPGNSVIRVSAAESLTFRPDVLLLAMKTQDLESACRQVRDLAQSSTIVTLQNGTRGDSIAAAFFPRENIISGVVMMNAQYLEPGKVTLAHAGELVIGSAFGRNNEKVREIKVLLDQAMKTEISENISGVRWSKLLLNNLGNGLEAMTGRSIRSCMHDAVIRRIGIYTLREGYHVIRQSGYRLGSLPGVPATLLKIIASAPDFVAGFFLKRSMGHLKTLSSTLQSLKRGRPTEIDYLNGEIVRLGRQTGIPTPLNSAVTDIVKDIEKTGRFYTSGDLAGRFAI